MKFIMGLAWKNLSRSSKVIGYKLTGTSIKALEEKIDSNGSPISIPIKFRDQVIGNVNISLPDNQELDQDDRRQHIDEYSRIDWYQLHTGQPYRQDRPARRDI